MLCVPGMAEIGNTCSQIYGSFTRIWISFVPMVLIYEPRHLKIIMGNNKVSRKNIFYGVLHNFIGEGLITNNGTEFYNYKSIRETGFCDLFH